MTTWVPLGSIVVAVVVVVVVVCRTPVEKFLNDPFELEYSANFFTENNTHSSPSDVVGGDGDDDDDDDDDDNDDDDDDDDEDTASCSISRVRSASLMCLQT